MELAQWFRTSHQCISNMSLLSNLGKGRGLLDKLDFPLPMDTLSQGDQKRKLNYGLLAQVS